MGSTRALTLWAQEAVFASGRATTAVRFIAVLVTALIRMLRGVAGDPAAGVATRNHSFCHTIFSLVVSPEAMIVRLQVFPAASAISSTALLGCWTQFSAVTPRLP